MQENFLTDRPDSGPDPRRFAGRDTSPGKWYEQVLARAMEFSRYEVFPQAEVGVRLGASKHRVDFVLRDGDARAVLVSAKWQSTPPKGVGAGTGEDKMVHEILTLGEVLRDKPTTFKTAYIVLGGMGFLHNQKKLDWYLDGQYKQAIQYADCVFVIHSDDFFDRLWRHTL